MQNSHLPMKQRVDWIDYAKGICILWVVMMYATAYVKDITHTIGWMQYVVNFAQPFRMPDFFMLSGLFVSRVLERPLRSYVDKKILHFLYFYLLWATLKFLNMHMSELWHGHGVALIPEYLRLFIEPPTGPLWFIYVLALFFIAVRLLRRVPVLLVLPVAMLLQIFVSWGDIEWHIKVIDKFCRYFVFFYFGHVFALFIFRAAHWARSDLPSALVLFAVWFTVNVVCVSLHLTFLPGMQLILGIVGALAVMLFSTMVARLPYTSWLRYFGTNSIVVYLGFVVPLGMMRRLVIEPNFPIDIGTLSLIITILSVAGAMAMYWIVRPTPLRFLFFRPKWTMISADETSSLKNTSAG